MWSVFPATGLIFSRSFVGSESQKLLANRDPLRGRAGILRNSEAGDYEEDAQGSPYLGHFPSPALSQPFLMKMSHLILAGYLSRVSSHPLKSTF